MRAGGKELSDFKEGRAVYAQTGCAACHRVGDYGNSGPGPNLTRIGLTLSAEQVERAILHPTAPMPSFKNLPAAKFRDVLDFLQQLN